MSDFVTVPRTSALEDIRRAITNVAVSHNEPPSVVLRRRIVVGIVLVIGATAMGYTMSRRPGESGFFALTCALAATWIAGALISGPLHLGGICWRGRNQRPVITGTTIGLVLGLIFVVGGLIVREIPAVAEYIARVLRFADQGPLLLVVAVTLLNGLAEEMFFRGALYTALGRHHPVIISTLLYIAAAMASGNPMLGVAALFLGTVGAWERRSTGGVLAPILTHLVWGLFMVLALPPLFGVR